MRKFLANNIVWLEEYFEKTKWMFEVTVFFFVLQTFLYSINLQSQGDITIKEISALKIIFWVLIFIITFLLYVKTETEYKPEEDLFSAPLFSGAIFSKYFMRLLIFTLLSISTIIFWKQIKLSFHNNNFQYFWAGLGVAIFFEVIRFFNFFFKKVRKVFNIKQSS